MKPTRRAESAGRDEEADSMKPAREKGILALGIMSGTSADGIDVALVRISARGATLENFATIPFSSRVRDAILRLGEGRAVTTGEISQLNFLLGKIFAEAALAACRKFRVSPARIALIGSHGQTVFHQGNPAPFCGERVASTLQIGESSVIASADGHYDGRRFSSGRYGGGRARRAAGAVCRLSAVPQRASGTRGAQYRRNCQYHCDSGGRGN